MEELLRLFGIIDQEEAKQLPPGPPMPRSQGVMPFHMQRGVVLDQMSQQNPSMVHLLQSGPSGGDPYYQMLQQIHSQLPQTTRQYFRHNDPDEGLPQSMLDMIYGPGSSLP